MGVYGLTGGTGSGKSEVARYFEEDGIPVIDADAIGHTLIAPGGPAVEAVLEAFGENIVSCGRIDRKKLGAIVFADAAALKKLNAIVHPPLKQALIDRCKALREAGHETIVVNAAILAEHGQVEPWLDGLVVVTSPVALRLKRLVEGRGLTPEEAQQRLNAQTPVEKKLPLADWVIVNEGDLIALRARAREVLEAMRSRENSA